MNISLAVSDSENCVVTTLTEWVKLKLFDRNNLWSSQTVHAVVTPGLCTDVILGLPFLKVNKIVTDHSNNTCVAKDHGYDLLNSSSGTGREGTIHVIAGETSQITALSKKAEKTFTVAT